MLSQTRQDSTIVSNKDIKSLLSAFDEWKVLKPQNALLNERVSLLNTLVKNRDSVIAFQRNQIRLHEEQTERYVKLEMMSDLERRICADRVKALENAVKKQKKKNRFTALAGVAGVAGVAALILLK